MSENRSWIEGGVYVIALAPASIVSRILSGLFPPVAIMGTSGNSVLIFRMISDYTERVASLKTVSSSPLVQQVYTYVQKHISEDCSIDEIAAAVFLSRSRLCTKFREESGKTVKDFVMEQKIAEAKKLLVVTTHPLSQISTYLGFSSQSYFNAVFRKAVGLSPRAYREKNTGSEEAH